MFHFPRFSTYDYEFIICSDISISVVAPFGLLRLNVCLRLHADFRSLLRPSSVATA